MAKQFEIRNKHIEDKHPTTIASEVISRPMTPEDWEKYGPAKVKKPVNSFIKRKEIEKPMEPKISKVEPNTSKAKKKPGIKFDTGLVIALIKKHGLDDAGRQEIAKELKVYPSDLNRIIAQKRIQDAIKEGGLSINTNTSATNNSKKQLIEDIAKELKVSEEPKQSNPKVELHMNLCADLHETYVAKNTAYGDSFSVTFKEFGIISALTRMSDKWNRIKALAAGARNDVNDESLEDSLMDLANYCTMTVMELKESMAGIW